MAFLSQKNLNKLIKFWGRSDHFRKSQLPTCSLSILKQETFQNIEFSLLLLLVEGFESLTCTVANANLSSE